MIVTGTIDRERQYSCIVCSCSLQALFWRLYLYFKALLMPCHWQRCGCRWPMYFLGSCCCSTKFAVGLTPWKISAQICVDVCGTLGVQQSPQKEPEDTFKHLNVLWTLCHEARWRVSLRFFATMFSLVWGQPRPPPGDPLSQPSCQYLPPTSRRPPPPAPTTPPPPPPTPPPQVLTDS